MVRNSDIEGLSQRRSIGDLKSITDDLEHETIRAVEYEKVYNEFDKISSIVHSIIEHFVNEDKETLKERLEEEEVLSKRDMLPERTESVHSRLAVLLKKEAQQKMNVIQWLDVYNSYLFLLINKLFGALGEVKVTEASRQFVEEAKQFTEKLYSANVSYIDKMSEQMANQRKDFINLLRANMLPLTDKLMSLVEKQNNLKKKIDELLTSKQASLSKEDKEELQKQFNELKENIKQLEMLKKSVEGSIIEESEPVVEEPKIEAKSEPEKEEEQDNKTYVCEYCGFTTTSKEEMKEHIRDKHSGSSEGDED